MREAVDQRVNNKPTKITALEELGKAKVAFAQAGDFISEMMASVKMGQHIELEQVNPVINNSANPFYVTLMHYWSFHVFVQWMFIHLNIL